MTYAELFAKDYLGTIFYYCLRKTGNENEADELVSDISLAVLQGLAVEDCKQPLCPMGGWQARGT